MATLAKSILIVDDEPDIREILEYEFNDRGYKTFAAESINTAQSILTKHKIDIVLTDVRMPDGSGIKLLKYIMKHTQQHVPKVILVTGYADISEEEAREIGATAILSKPIDYDELERILGP